MLSENDRFSYLQLIVEKLFKLKTIVSRSKFNSKMVTFLSFENLSITYDFKKYLKSIQNPLWGIYMQ